MTIVPDKVNEVEIRRYEMLLHNLQSSFDTYVIHGGYRFGNRKLKMLRSYFSLVFHLLQITGRLLHFYERHDLKYNLILTATAEEETTGENSIKSILDDIGPFDFSIVGEPTGMKMAIAEMTVTIAEVIEVRLTVMSMNRNLLMPRSLSRLSGILSFS